VRGPEIAGEMAPDIPLDKQRPAEYVFAKHVQEAVEQIHTRKAELDQQRRSAAE
jgi:hypothetical protein